MSILEKITEHKRVEVAERKSLFPLKLLERSIYFETPPVSLSQYIRREDKCGIIAEIKRKSPSRGVINKHICVEQLSIGYMQAGASALSVLTDESFFGGCSSDLSTARKFNYCPILRKEFIVDEYQIVEARSIGADAILLIASILSAKEIHAFTKLAHSLHMEVLLEIHSRDELPALDADVDLVGVNNRNLADFETNVERSMVMSDLIPGTFTKISESGINSPEVAFQLKKSGYHGLLIGEQFMRHSRPEEACAQFIHKLKMLCDES